MDSVVRLKQLNQPEVSGFVVNIILQYLKTGTISGISSNTGQLSGVFYPLISNPSDYVINSQITGLASQTLVINGNTAVLTSVASNFYPLHTNPSGYLTTGTFGTGAFYPLLSNPSDFASFVLNVGQPQFNGYVGNILQGYGISTDVIETNQIYASGDFNDISRLVVDVANQQILNVDDGFSAIDWDLRQLGNSNGFPTIDWQNKKLISDVPSFFNPGIGVDWANRILSGQWNIDLVNFPHGFTVSGTHVLTGNQTGTYYSITNPSNFVTFGQLTSTSGNLKATDAQNFAFSLANMVVVTGLNQQVSGIKQFGNDLRVGSNSGSPIHEIKADGEIRFDNSRVMITTGGDFIVSGTGNLTALYNNGLVSFASGRAEILSDGRFSGDGSLLRNLTGFGTTVADVVYQTGNQNISGFKTFQSSGAFAQNIGARFIGYYDTGSHSIFLSSGVDLFNSRLLYNNIPTIDWKNCLITANDNSLSIDWFQRQLKNNINVLTLDWNTQMFLGGWVLGTDSSITMSAGASILSQGGDTAYKFQSNATDTITSQNVVQLGNFNPAHFSIDYGSPSISINTAILTGGGGTGGGPTGQLTGAFYPLGSNPSGYLSVYNQSGAYLFSHTATSGVTQEFINFPTSLGNNPFVLASLNNFSGTENIFVQTSGIKSTGFWANYSNTIDSNGYVLTVLASLSLSSGLATTVIIQNITGGASGSFYPLTANPSGYITTGQTGNFGQAVNTGQLTGTFYPLGSNPSGYLSVYNQSGAYIFTTHAVSGLTQQFISFPTTLGSNPFVLASLNNLSGTENIFSQVSGITSSGFWVNYSNVIDGGGYLLTTLASLSASSGLATTVIIQNITGGTTGSFYPLVGNPSGFITTGQTGAFGTATNTGNLTGAFYPLSQNPSGYLSIYNQSGAYLFSTIPTNGVNQQFISFPTNLGANPFVIPALTNILGAENISVQASGITSSGYWAQFSNTIDSTGYLLTTLASLSTASGLATTVIIQNIAGVTGSFYPLVGNPSGFITTGQTGSFGGGATPTGQLTGTFYPLASNPSGYLSSLGNVVLSSGNQTISGNKNFIGITHFLTGGINVAIPQFTLDISGNIGNSLGPLTIITNSGLNLGSYNGILNFHNDGVVIGQLENDFSNITFDFALENITFNSVAGFVICNPDFYAQSNFFLSGTGITNFFYPLHSNPSGYITTGQTGAFGGGTGSVLTGNLTGAFYPLKGNPSGFLSSSQNVVFTSGTQTISGLKIFSSVEIVGGNISLESSSLLTFGAGTSATSQGGDTIFEFLSAADGLVNANTVNQLGNFNTGHFNIDYANTVININPHILSSGNYPLTGNPSGFITTGQTGAFGSAVNTGGLTGTFYPLIGNPSGFITAVQTGFLSTGGFPDITDSKSNHRIGIVQTNPQFTLDVNGSIGNSNGNIPSSSIDLSNTYLKDGSNVISIIWNSRTLLDASQAVSLDWTNRIISGNWKVQALTISGSPVVLASQTGNFGSGGNTGILTGYFYPLKTNPSGYITTGQTGNFISTGLTGALTGQFYPLRTNPSGYITTGQTGLFYPSSNPSGFLTSATVSGLNIPTNVNFPSGIYTLDWRISTSYFYTLSGNSTFNFTGGANGQTIVVGVVNTGIYTVNWPSGSGTFPSGITGIFWQNKSAPLQTVSGTDIYTFIQLNTGIYGSAVQGF